ncbi:hypothetical protein [Saccharothrix saharensis]|uniref:hypothetical protein n=1 Tax=Saccharothrix saharensis TaxID=571190 RepID=UPI00114EC1DC|nr:hypothetical protein [Saccharothrix saharensis]
MKPWLPRLARFVVAAGLGAGVLWVALLDPAPRGEMSTFGQFALAAATMVLLLWDQLVKVVTHAPVDVDGLADDLAQAMRAQWQQAATERGLLQPAPLPIRWRRSREPVAGPSSAATTTRDGHVPFDPLPGLDRVTSARLRNGDRRTLHRIYGGLPSGRLIITGEPGSGKSSAAVLLLLDALRYRDQVDPAERQRVPVPVLITLSGWNPGNQPFMEWLVGKLGTLPLLHGRRGGERATALLRAGRIAVFLDGLDEMPEHTRAIALRSLTRQVTARLVLLTRTRELVVAATQHILVGAVALELLPLRPPDVADHLLRPLPDPPPPSWRRVADTVVNDAGHPLTQAVSTPLTVNLVRDTYPVDGPVDELLDTSRFADAAAIIRHLLDHVIESAYAQGPGKPVSRYDGATARRTLFHIAGHLSRAGSRDLEWWSLPTWVPRPVRVTLATAVGTGAGWIVFATMGIGSPPAKFSGVALYGLTFGLAATFVVPDPPHRVRLAVGHLVRPRLTVPERIGVVVGGAVPGIAVWQVTEPIVGLALGAVLVFGFAAFLGLLNGTTSSGGLEAAEPVEAWRHDVIAHLLSGALAGVAVWLLTFSLSGWTAALAYGVLTGLLVASATQTFLAQVYFTLRYGTPIRLLRFLEDARSRHLIRTVGPVYQFRHALLQDHLAEAPTSGNPPER